jgi:hypothetical protein
MLSLTFGELGDDGASALVWMLIVGSGPLRSVSRVVTTPRSSRSEVALREIAAASARRWSPGSVRSIAAWRVSVCSATAWVAKALARSRALAGESSFAVTATMLLWATGSAVTFSNSTFALSGESSSCLTRLATSTFVTS